MVMLEIQLSLQLQCLRSVIDKAQSDHERSLQSKQRISCIVPDRGFMWVSSQESLEMEETA